MTRKSVLIIGEDPALIDFDSPGAPEDMSAEKVMAGLNRSIDRLKTSGCRADLLLTTDDSPVEDQLTRALAGTSYDVIVVGAGLRTLPPMAEKFERIINTLHEQTPRAKLAFNSHPDDSDAAARRWL